MPFRAERGETAAVDEDLVRRHLPLVDYVVAEMASRLPRHVPRADLVSAGMAGLAEAARRFDPDKGVPFARWANRRIKWAILDELRSMDWATRDVRARARAVEGTADRLRSELGREATTDELADAVGLSAKDVTEVFEDVHRGVVIHLDGLGVAEPEAVLPPGAPAPEAELLDREQKSYLMDAVSVLPERLRHVIVQYFFMGRQMQDIADELGVTESRVSQMRAEAVALLRDGMNSQLDPERVDDLADEPVGRVAKRKAAYYAAVAAASDYRSRLSVPAGNSAATA